MVLSVECGATNTNAHHNNDRLNIHISQTLLRSNPHTTLPIFESPAMYVVKIVTYWRLQVIYMYKYVHIQPHTCALTQEHTPIHLK